MFFLLNKPAGISSFKAINDFAKKQNIKKIGHTGTLDPFATGLLLLATDEDTKLISYIENKTKSYIATIQFGLQTDTYDLMGEIINQSNKKITNKDVSLVESWLLAQKSQIPPIYSAKKINGTRSYQLARENKSVELKPQNIEVSQVKVLAFDEDKQQLQIALTVSNGAFIRSLANDLAIYLNTFGHLIALQRTMISNFDISLLNNNEFVKINSAPALKLDFLPLKKREISRLKKGLNLIKKLQFNNPIDLFIIDEQLPNEILGIVKYAHGEIKVQKLFGNKLIDY
ncbi:tRNA pseudouridine(55) synthase TruB [Mycoplasmopsis iners]|uniref:tRNA pseudouridine(55) synthase TruB n=1 Tax=Mycoplasmopsis iners TaxID=76630 RepID=UPI0004985879|nr:tRNA pseudouridine(55) synthase TruB [Mycoplasmopsis iners]